MKWLLFTSASVAVLIALGLLAVDERDVVWEGRKALCAYCRAEVAYHAVVCRECDRTLDWRSAKEECRWCLSRTDIDHLRGVYEGLKHGGPLPEPLVAYEAYFGAIDEGKCTYCGGIGSVAESGREVNCPVCRGDKPDGRCIACGGSRSVVIGDDGAHRLALERADARTRAHERAAVADLPLDGEMLVDRDVDALRGYTEAEDLRDPAGRNLLEMARERLHAAFRVLHEEHTRREKGGS